MSSTGRAVLRSLILPLTAAVVTLAFLGMLLAGPFASSPTPANAAFLVVVDQGGANDVNAEQNDLTMLGQDTSDPNYLKLFISWDSTDLWTSVSATGDACTLFDTNGNGNIDFVFCGEIDNFNADPLIVDTGVVA